MNEDLKGKIFGSYKVLGYNEIASKHQGNSMWICMCTNCGRILNIRKPALLKGENTQCRFCTMTHKIDPNDYIGKVFGTLEVLSLNEEETKIKHKTTFNCRCTKCHKVKTITVGSLNDPKRGTGCDCGRSGLDAKNTINMIGEKIGDLTVIEVDYDSMRRLSSRNIIYKCRCSKGHITGGHNGTRLREHADSEYCKVCYPYPGGPNFKDLTGQMFGRLRIRCMDSFDQVQNKVFWKCDCYREGELVPHNTIICTTEELKFKRSCGCKKDEWVHNQFKYNPTIVSQLRGIYKTIGPRCNDPQNPQYERYGGRGITTDYTKFEDFYNDYAMDYIQALEWYGTDVTIDRINNSKGYEKGNIRFIPRAANDANKNNNLLIEFANQIWTLTMLHKLRFYFNNPNLGYYQLKNRIFVWKWSPIVALTVLPEDEDAVKKGIIKPHYNPIINYNDLALLHKKVQEIHQDDIDYLFYTGNNSITINDKENIQEENKLIRDKKREERGE